MAAMTNAERQRRWRERHRTGDLFPPLNAPGQPNVTPPGVTLDAIEKRPVAIINASGKPRQTEILAVRPCPFCGGVPSVRVFEHSNYTGYSASCDGCGAIPPYCDTRKKFYTAEDLQTALDLWNRRPGL